MARSHPEIDSGPNSPGISVSGKSQVSEVWIASGFCENICGILSRATKRNLTLPRNYV